MMHRAPWALAVAALAALALSALGQAGLERARTLREGAPGPAWLLLVVGAVLAAVATWTRPLTADVPKPAFALSAIPWPWYVAFLPAAACFLAAFLLHRQPRFFGGHPLPVRIWLAGLLLFLMPGVGHAVATWRAPHPPRAGWSRRTAAGVCVALFAGALLLRTWGGVERLPAWVENDESNTGSLGRLLYASDLSPLFGFIESNPSITFLWARIAELLFGDNLWGFRTASAVVGSLTVVLLYDFGRRLVGDLPALLGALLLAVNHVHLNLSRVGHPPFMTPFFAALALNLLMRAFTGEGLLPLAGTAVVLGVGAPSYNPSHILPALLLITGLGWAAAGRFVLKRSLGQLGLIVVGAVLIAAPMLDTIWELRNKGSLTRVEGLSLFAPANQESLRRDYGAPDIATAVRRHAIRTVSLFNFGRDEYPSYRCERAFLDPVCAALLPLTALLLLIRVGSPLAWGFWIWTPAYLLGGVFLCAAPTTYHRIAAVLLFMGLGLGWAVLRIGHTIARGLALPSWFPAALGTAFVAAAAYANVVWYFRDFALLRKPEHRTAFTFLACRYAGTHTVLDATALDGNEYVPLHNLFPQFQCPTLDRLRVKRSDEIWDVEALTTKRHVALIVPEKVVAVHPGSPAGYRVVKDFVDATITSPEPLPLHVYELEREAGKATDDGPAAR